VIRGVVSLARSAWRRIIDRAAPLPGLADVCPRALDAAWRRVGPAAVPVNRILGTASYPPGTRRRDFLPVRGYAPTDWQSRWDRLTLASANFAVLPPVGLVHAGDGYWGRRPQPGSARTGLRPDADRRRRRGAHANAQARHARPIPSVAPGSVASTTALAVVATTIPREPVSIPRRPRHHLVPGRERDPVLSHGLGARRSHGVKRSRGQERRSTTWSSDSA
jgi:hypothetical protein